MSHFSKYINIEYELTQIKCIFLHEYYIETQSITIVINLLGSPLVKLIQIHLPLIVGSIHKIIEK